MELVAALDISLTQLHQLFRRCFEEYLVPLQFDAPQFADRLRLEGVDLSVSQLMVENGEACGVMLVSRRGSRSRLSAMGIVPAVRHRGLGTWAVQELLDQARVRGDREIVLEVIEQNDPAVALYRSAGFQTVRRLVGFRQEPAPGGASLEDVEVEEFARAMATHCDTTLPWQIDAAAAANAAAPHRAVRHGPVWALLSDPGSGPLVLKSMVVESDHRRQGLATQFLKALPETSDRPWRVPAVVPEDDCAGPFDAAGWQRESISQWEMRRVLAT